MCLSARHLMSALLLSAALPAAAQPPAEPHTQARALHTKYCVQCHQSEVYTRANRRMKDLNALRNQVQRCDQNIGLRWFDDDINAVTQYLNDQYYHFKK
jgi:hypothetical protein